jgi:hypothetical protein
MKILVEYVARVNTYDDHKAVITLVPGPIRRFFGAKTRRGHAYKTKHYSGETFWRWANTERLVGRRITREIECGAVEDLPKAVLHDSYDSKQLRIEDDLHDSKQLRVFAEEKAKRK